MEKKLIIVLLFLFVLLTVSCQQNPFPDGSITSVPIPPEREFNDIRDGIMAVPTGDELIYWESFGLTKQMFQDPSIMTEEDVANLDLAISTYIQEHHDDFIRMITDDDLGSNADKTYEMNSSIDSSGRSIGDMNSITVRTSTYGMFSTTTYDSNNVLERDVEVQDE
jgi:hypothetical protein